MPNRIVTLLAGSTVAVALAACSTGSAAISSPGGAAPTAAATASAATAGAVATAAPIAGGARVSANSASQAEIAAALAAAGVPNADRWAREVTEYRPYPADDPTLARLQANLAKYNPDPATLQAILSALQP